MDLNKININLLIDFDSTFIILESLEIISLLSLKNDKNTISKIAKITDDAMKGEISFSKALNKRIKMLNANRAHLNQTIQILKNNISKSFIKNIDFIKNNSSNIFIISGGFKELIFPIVEKFNLKYENIYANDFLFDSNDNIIGIDQSNPLSKDQGKATVADNISGENIIIGDGYTDYEIKKYGAANTFIQFTENINRKNINSKADLISNNFDQIISFIKKNN